MGHWWEGGYAFAKKVVGTSEWPEWLLGVLDLEMVPGKRTAESRVKEGVRL